MLDSDIQERAYSEDDFDYDLASCNQSSIRQCLFCGKPFYPIGRNSSRQQYCKRSHFVKCFICGKPIKQVAPSIDRAAIKLTCCKKCVDEFRASQTKKAVSDKYGVDNVSKVKDIHDKAVASIKAKAPQTTQKIVKTMQEKYGGMGTQSVILREKIESTMIARYGVSNPDESIEFRRKISDSLKSDEVRSKYKSASMMHYGTAYPAQSAEVKKKMETTLMQNHGVPLAGLVPGSHEKAKQTCLARYGVSCFLMTDYAQERAREGYIQHMHDRNNKISKLNQSVADYFKSEFGIETEFEKNLHGKSYDLHVKDTNILIEIDPSYTHSDLPNHWCGGIDPNYHLDKTKFAEADGYRCVHVFDWDKLSDIGSLFNEREKVYARNCQVKMIDAKEAHEFIEENHIQGDARGTKFTAGLFFNDRLVCVMTLGCARYNKKYQWELLRLCSLKEVEVVGGPSKLFSFFIRNESPQSVISYCDRAKFSGSVYYKMGFRLDHCSRPAKVWSRGDKHVTDNLLRQRGFDQLFGTSYGRGTSNEQLMIENGWRSVYDCGQLVFVWTRSEQCI